MGGAVQGRPWLIAGVRESEWGDLDREGSGDGAGALSWPVASCRPDLESAPVTESALRTRKDGALRERLHPGDCARQVQGLVPEEARFLQMC